MNSMGGKYPRAYAVRHKNEVVRASSRSGGAFTAISDWILMHDGIIYGCALDEYFHAVHIRAENSNERNKMRGSKYLQSKLGDTYKNVKYDLANDKMVLFTGTACQVAGLKKYLGIEYDNLFCVDIVCHGVPSLRVWDSYLKWLEKREKAKISAVNFRDKSEYGWRAHVESIRFNNGHVIKSRVFANLFNGRYPLRPSCYECPYKSLNRLGDITIADYWGIENVLPEFDDDKGVSLLLVNTSKGKELFDSLREKIKWKETRVEDCIQPALKGPFSVPSGRERFWRDFSEHSFQYIAKKYGDIGFINFLKSNLRKVKKAVMK